MWHVYSMLVKTNLCALKGKSSQVVGALFTLGGEELIGLGNEKCIAGKLVPIMVLRKHKEPPPPPPPQ